MDEPLVERGNLPSPFDDPATSDEDRWGHSEDEKGNSNASVNFHSGLQIATRKVETIRKIMGISYAHSYHFWLLQMPTALVVGLLVGASVFGFFVLYFSVHNLWVSNLLPGKDSVYGPIYSDPQENEMVTVEFISNVGFQKGGYNWIFVTTLGGFLSGLILLCPGAPKVGNQRNMIDYLNFDRPRTKEAPFTIIHTFIAMSSGASIGPETALATIGAEIGSLISTLLRFNAREKALMVLTGISASLGLLTASPILGVLMVIELSLLARPSDIRLDALVEQKIPDTNNRNIKTIISTQGQAGQHDLMNQTCLLSLGCITSFFVCRIASQQILPQIAFPDFGSLMQEVFEVKHVFYAIPLGVICGLCGILYLIMQGVFRAAFLHMEAMFHDCSMPNWVHSVFMLTLAGLLNGIIAVSFPLTLGSGIDMLLQLLSLGLNNVDAALKAGVENGDNENLSPLYLLISAFMNMLATAICLGFGMMGGVFLPLIFSGLLIGLALPNYLPFIPTIIAVPCCVCGIVTSFVPTPFSFLLTLMIFADIPGDVGAAMLITTIVAHTVNGGFGFVSRLAAQRHNTRMAELGKIHESARSTDSSDLTSESFKSRSDRSVKQVKRVSSIVFGDELS